MGSRDTPNRLKLATLWRHVWRKLCTPAGSLNDDCPSPASILSISCCRLGHGALHFHCRGSMAWRRCAAWRRWVAWWRLAWRGLAWWRLAWRWWLGLAWWRLGLVAWVGLGLSHTTADLCASTSLLLSAASLLPWPRILSATACLLCSAVSLRIRPRLPQLWRFSVLQRWVSRVWHVDDDVPQQLRHT